MVLMKYALVFGGGGGKGAYEIGVWKALDEMGYANRFACVIGTSVGALDGALFCQQNIQDAQQAWLRDLGEAQLLRLNVNPHALLKSPPAGLFNQEGLKNLLERHLPDVMPDTPDFYVCVSEISGRDEKPNFLQALFAAETYQAQYVKMNGCSRQEAIEHLSASSAIPVAFSPVGQRRDGGMLMRNNVPYHEAARMGYEKILAVSLGNEAIHMERLDICEERRGTKYEQEPIPSENNGFSGALVLCPTVPLGRGSFPGLLDFSEENAKWRMELGYENCMGLYRENLASFFAEASDSSFPAPHAL